MRDGCYSFGDILAFAAHHLVWIGEASSVETQLRGGALTVRAFLRERYGVFTGESERGDKSDLTSDSGCGSRTPGGGFGGYGPTEKRREQWRRVRVWRAETPKMVM